MCDDQVPKNEMAIVSVRPVQSHIGYVIGTGKVDPNLTAIGDRIVRITLDDHGVEKLEKLTQEYKIIHNQRRGTP